MPDNEIIYHWNGTPIRLTDWAPDAFGEYEYLTQSGRHFFRFELVPIRGNVQIYILEGPSYGQRATDGHSTHRFYDYDRDLHYVCIRDDLEPETVPEALSWLIQWAEGTGTYIDTGRDFS